MDRQLERIGLSWLIMWKPAPALRVSREDQEWFAATSANITKSASLHLDGLGLRDLAEDQAL
jgi:hypothetical protein